MIRVIQPKEFSLVEHLIDGFVERISQDVEQVPRLKDRILRDIESGAISLLASFDDQNTAIGFATFRPSESEIGATHPLDDTWRELFAGVLHHLKTKYSVIRIRGGAVPESMYDMMTGFGLTRIDDAHMSIERREVEALDLGGLPEGYSIVGYTSNMKKLVAEMLYESYLGISFARQYPDQIGSVQACQQTLGKLSEGSRLSILMAGALPIGSCLVTVHGVHGDMGLVAIRPEYRKRGLGRSIVTHALLDAVREDHMIESIHLAAVHGDPAFYLYESMGFSTNSIQPLFAWSKRE